ncbi:MAG: cation diffusion facilitator family transporter [Lachnospiraceae bacterium]|nr:cation diffusion facilitator family transporter [Lachnospiraceae bacterium]
MPTEGEKILLDRNKKIIRASVIGIGANVLLAVFKAIIGLASNSIAIVMDAVNNISDAASSVITIVGTRLAGKEADKKHPFGYGRIEYLSAMVISVIVLYAGITAFVESVKKIIDPTVPDYKTVSLIIVAVAVVVKIVLGLYVKKVGTDTNSDSLVNSGTDALLDSIISASTIVAALIYLFFNISLEAWLGAIIALIIIKSGWEMLRSTLSQILGERVDPGIVVAIKSTIREFPEVSGAYDLILHNYGPDTYNGSVHIEIPDTLSAGEIDELTRKVVNKVYKEHGIILTGVGVYSINTKDEDVIADRDKISKIVLSNEHVLQMHGFYIDRQEKTIRFDAVISFEAEDRHKVFEKVCADVKEAYPDYSIQAALDMDFSEL